MFRKHGLHCQSLGVKLLLSRLAHHLCLLMTETQWRDRTPVRALAPDCHLPALGIWYLLFRAPCASRWVGAVCAHLPSRLALSHVSSMPGRIPGDVRLGGCERAAPLDTCTCTVRSRGVPLPDPSLNVCSVQALV